jgi:hypothetical protein
MYLREGKRVRVNGGGRGAASESLSLDAPPKPFSAGDERELPDALPPPLALTGVL